MAETTVTQQIMLSAVASGTSPVIGPAFMSRVRENSFYANFSAGSSTGVVTIETADDPNFTGTWASLGTLTFASASKVEYLRVPGVLLAVRARLSTTVTGGTVTVTYVGN